MDRICRSRAKSWGLLPEGGKVKQVTPADLYGPENEDVKREIEERQRQRNENRRRPTPAQAAR